MKVLLVATVQSHICQFHRPLVNMLHNMGATVDVAARDNLAEKNGLALDFADKVFNVCFSRLPKSADNIRAYKQLKKIIDEGNYDVVHCNTPMGGIVTRLAAKKARKKGTRVYYTAHGFHFYKGASKKNWLVFYPIERFFAKAFTDKLITIVKEDYELASAKFKTDVYHIHGVGVNEEKYRSVTDSQTKAFRKEMGYEDRFVILCTGELNKNKNQAFLINAMPKVVEKYPNVLLLLAGNGPEQDNLEKQILDLGLSKNVKLIGYRTDLEKYTNACDLVVSASKREGLPLNIMEAMICGKAVIASNNRGHRELVKNGKTGVILDDFRAENMSSAIIDLIDNEDRRKDYEELAKEEIVPYISCNVEKELSEIYELQIG